jgi:hypothetical protein
MPTDSNGSRFRLELTRDELHLLISASGYSPLLTSLDPEKREAATALAEKLLLLWHGHR